LHGETARERRGDRVDKSRQGEAAFSHLRTRARIEPRGGRQYCGRAALVEKNQQRHAGDGEEHRDHG